MALKRDFVFIFAAGIFWRLVRVVEGARLESVYMGNCIKSSNLLVSATACKFFEYLQVSLLKERCQSGRMGRSRKPLYGQLYPGFESLSFR